MFLSIINAYRESNDISLFKSTYDLDYTLKEKSLPFLYIVTEEGELPIIELWLSFL